MIVARSVIVQTRTAYRGNLFNVEVKSWVDSRGRAISREVVRHPGAVVIVPVLKDGRLVMIRNQRVAVDEEVLELPAGKLEPGEEPRLAAGRELEEETGYSAGAIAFLGEFYTSPGFSDELMRAFVASDLRPVGQRLEAGESIQAEVLDREDVMRRLDAGQIRDGKSIAALWLWQRRAAGGEP
jgi:ADP-ribose pyrophosphatase